MLRFTLRRLLLAIGLIGAVLVAAPALWHCHITAPRRLDVLHPGQLDLAGTTIYFPVQRESVAGYYVWDGGTYGVQFTDAQGIQHLVGSWHSNASPEHRGTILLEGITPDRGGRTVGKLPVAERLIFSVMELEDQSDQERPTVMQMVYPTTGDFYWSVWYRLGLW